MYVSVRQHGGFLGSDRKVEIRDGRVLVTSKGITEEAASLDGDDLDALRSIVGKVLESTAGVMPLKGSLPSDAMDTQIEVGEGSRRRTLKLRSGDQAPTEVWELLGAVNRISSASQG